MTSCIDPVNGGEISHSGLHGVFRDDKGGKT
jgi:hypothetical protein